MDNYLLGIAWSETQLKLVCLKKEGKKYRLWKLDQLPISLNKPEELSKSLAQWSTNWLPKDSQVGVILTLPESSIFLKELEIPKVKGENISEAIFWEISSVVPVPPSETVIQWQKISEEEKLTCLAAIIVKNETVQDLLPIIEKAGLQLLAIEPSSVAFSRLWQGKLRKTTLLVIPEGNETNFVVLKNGVPVFSNSITTLLAGMKTKKKKLNREISSTLATNAKKIISFWEAKEEGKVQQVIITGEGIRYSGLAKAINSFVHIPVIFGKMPKFPQVEISGQPKMMINRYLVPLGAALKPLFDDQTQEVNLLPEKERKILEKEKWQRKMAERILLFAKITLTLLAVNLLIFGGAKLWRLSLSREISQTKLFVGNHPGQKFIPEIQKTNKLLSQVGWLMENQKDTGERLRQITELTPVNIYFTNLEFNGLQKEEWKIAGVSDRDDILSFYEKLQSNSGASQVLMPYSNLQKEKGGDFKITIIW